MFKRLQRFQPTKLNTLSRFYGSNSHEGDHHHREGQEPGGYFLDLKPGRQTYFWEPYWYIGYYGAFAIFFAGLAFNPRKGPTENARIEAQKRMAARGEDFKWPFPQ